MKDLQSVTQILRILDELYPWEDKCFLRYDKPWQLLVATLLSAQCTDDRVNKVTPGLFERYPTLESLAAANLADMENEVMSTGFYHMKALHIIQCAQILLAEHGGELPSDIGLLTQLPGVGRKTANVIRGHIFHIPSIVVDTHVKRISNRLGLTQYDDPVKIEYELMETLPQDHWIKYNIQGIMHGRKVCSARSPKCTVCGLAGECDSCT